MATKRRVDPNEPQHIPDEDGDVSTDADLCERCGCLQGMHEDGKGECAGCGNCMRFKAV
jgi:hypothetical protein